MLAADRRRRKFLGVELATTVGDGGFDRGDEFDDQFVGHVTSAAPS
jgi:hypothetical protein